MKKIKLSECEIQSKLTRVDWAEGLILQLPVNHDGRNSWLVNYGKSLEAIQLRNNRNIDFDKKTLSAIFN